MKAVKAPRPIISVLQEDIDLALPAESRHCMIQLAIQRQIPAANHIIVDIQTIRWSDRTKGLRYTYFTPAKVIATMVAWDEGMKPAPFEFELRGPQVTTMRIRETVRGRATGKAKLIYKFGQRKRVAPEKTAMRATVVGGKPPPITRFSNRRAFGSRKLAALIGGQSLVEYLRSKIEA